MRPIQRLVLVMLSASSSLWAPALGADRSTTVVARTAQPLKVGDKTTGRVEAGEVLTVLSDQGDHVWVRAGGGDGWLPKAAAAPLAEADRVYEGLIAGQPGEPKHHVRRAMVWSLRGEPAKMLADYQRAIELGTRDPNAYVNRGVQLATEGKYDQAIADYSTALQFGSKDSSIYFNRAVAYYGKGDFAKSLEDYGVAIQRGERSYSVYISRAMAYAALGQDAKAIEDYGTAIGLDPKKPLAYHRRGLLLGDQQQFDAAIKDFDETLRRDPKFVEAYNSRGFVWFLKNDPEKAVRDFSEAIRLNPQFALAYNNRGYNRQLLGKYAEAVADFDQAVKLAPKYGMALRNKAWLLATCPDDKTRNGQEALKCAQQACELGQWKHAPDLRALAAAYAETNAFNDAIKWQTKSLELTPPDQPEQVKQGQELLAVYKSGKPYRLNAK